MNYFRIGVFVLADFSAAGIVSAYGLPFWPTVLIFFLGFLGGAAIWAAEPEAGR